MPDARVEITIESGDVFMRFAEELISCVSASAKYIQPIHVGIVHVEKHATEEKLLIITVEVSSLDQVTLGSFLNEFLYPITRDSSIESIHKHSSSYKTGRALEYERLNQSHSELY
jgi:hypothetical protein